MRRNSLANKAYGLPHLFCILPMTCSNARIALKSIDLYCDSVSLFVTHPLNVHGNTLHIDQRRPQTTPLTSQCHDLMRITWRRRRKTWSSYINQRQLTAPQLLLLRLIESHSSTHCSPLPLGDPPTQPHIRLSSTRLVLSGTTQEGQCQAYK